MPRLPVSLAAIVLLLAAASAPAQYVPPVPKGLRGDTEIGTRDIPLPDLRQKWMRATTPNFTMVSSASDARTRDIAGMLESVAGALSQVHPRFDAKFADTTVFLFGSRRDSQPFFELLLNRRGTRAPGAFVVQPDGSAAMIVDARKTLDTDRTVKHELMHRILARSGARLPLWLEEGIAEYFSTTVVTGNTVVIGRPIPEHQNALRFRGALPTRDVLEARSGSKTASSVLFYPQSWAMVDWMMRSDREAFYAFVSAVENGADAATAFRRHFSNDVEVVARSIRSAWLRPVASSVTRINRTSVPVAISAIDTSDALLELARFLRSMESTRDDAERYLRAALTADPQHARATAALGSLRASERRYDEAMPFFDEALRLAPDDPTVRIEFAEALLQNAIGPFAGATELEDDAPERFRRARELVAPVAGGDQPLADAILGTTYLIEDDTTPGIAPLERAHAARPARLDYALNLYALYVRAERHERAEELFKTVFERSSQPQVALAARSIYVRERLARANQLVREQRLDEAADLLREMVEVTPDAAAKADLVRQAENLAKIAGANREVVAYNSAVDAFNRKRNRAALEILDRLLEGATDEEIRQKAEDLRKSVRRRLRGM